MRFTVRRDRDDGQIFYRELVGIDPGQEPEPIDPPLGPRDHFRLEGRLNRPAYWCLFWFDTTAEVNAVAESTGAWTEVHYPPRGDRMMSVSPEDPPGVHLLVLVAGAAAPDGGKEALIGRLRGMTGRVTVLPKRWSFQTRGPGGEQVAPPTLQMADFLRAVQRRLPEGLEPIQLVSLQTRR